jgi:osmotically-inducible protein OsmY
VESMSGEKAFERASASNDPMGAPPRLPAQFESANDKRDWQGSGDERIKLAVMTALHWDLAVPRDRVQVSVERGQVIMTGRVAREYEKARAEADALMVAGVMGVTNQITFFDEQ